VKVLLLDLDGTLTEARKPIGGVDLGKIRAVFSYLSRQYEIGVVTGSPLPFMLEQIGPLWGSGVISKWMPCNGTQMYVDGDREVRHRVEMREEVGGSYEKIVREIFSYQQNSSSSVMPPIRAVMTTVSRPTPESGLGLPRVLEILFRS
jgi:hydroxymethylpyrimidine pyrophosphatase-like HAD family hydrolase